MRWDENRRKQTTTHNAICREIAGKQSESEKRMQTSKTPRIIIAREHFEILCFAQLVSPRVGRGSEWVGWTPQGRVTCKRGAYRRVRGCVRRAACSLDGGRRSTARDRSLNPDRRRPPSPALRVLCTNNHWGSVRLCKNVAATLCRGCCVVQCTLVTEKRPFCTADIKYKKKSTRH